MDGSMRARFSSGLLRRWRITACQAGCGGRGMQLALAAPAGTGESNQVLNDMEASAGTGPEADVAVVWAGISWNGDSEVGLGLMK